MARSETATVIFEENLVGKSFIILDKECEQEVREAEDVLSEIIEIGKKLFHRLEKLKEHKHWEANGSVGDEPNFIDQDTKEIKSARFALAPCKLVNTQLTALVNIVLRYYLPEKLKSIMNSITKDNAIAKSMEQIQQISIYSEEAMEQEALDLIFKMVQLNPKTYKVMMMKFSKQDSNAQFNLKYLVDDNTYRFLTSMKRRMNKVTDILSRNKQERMSLLHVLVVDVIKHLQNSQPLNYKGLVFKYFSNYLTMVAGELQLLTTPLMLYNHKLKRGFLAPAWQIPDIIQRYLEKKPLQYEKKEYLEYNMGTKSHCDLSSQTFTFVGAGFPLTGVILHILTGGSKINLVDCDATAVRNAKLFVEITNSLGITDAGAITVLHANGEDMVYRPTWKCKELPQDNHKKYGENVVPTDFLDIASAIPRSVTLEILRDSAKEVAVVRKRNTRGISEIMYQKFTIQTEFPFKEKLPFELVMEVSPPQKVVSGASPNYLVAGFMSTRNINSCQLYLNSELMRNSSITFNQHLENENKIKEIRLNDEQPQREAPGMKIIPRV